MNNEFKVRDEASRIGQEIAEGWVLADDVNALVQPRISPKNAEESERLTDRGDPYHELEITVYSTGSGEEEIYVLKSEQKTVEESLETVEEELGRYFQENNIVLPNLDTSHPGLREE